MPFASSVVSTSVFASELNSNLTQTQVFSYSISVPQFYPAGNFTGRIFIQSIDTVHSLQVSVVVPENRTIIVDSANSSVLEAGAAGYIYLPVRNRGNVNVYLNANSSSNLLEPPKMWLVAAGSDSQLPLKYSSPLSTIGNFTSVVSEPSFANYNVSFSVLDK